MKVDCGLLRCYKFGKNLQLGFSKYHLYSPATTVKRMCIQQTLKVPVNIRHPSNATNWATCFKYGRHGSNKNDLWTSWVSIHGTTHV